MSKIRVMVVDDSVVIRKIVSDALAEDSSIEVVGIAANGKIALQKIPTLEPDIVTLDMEMPEMDGLDVCRSLRRDSEVPILFLSSRDDEIDRVIGLELGADDYVTKPFSPRELVARINAILKRSRSTGASEPEPIVRLGPLMIDPTEHRASWDEAEITLTATEFQMLLALARQPRRVFTRDDLMRSVYPPGIHVSDRTLDSHMRHVRAKLSKAGAERLIETVHGVGFRMNEP